MNPANFRLDSVKKIRWRIIQFEVEINLVSLQQMIKAGMHLGHYTRQWNPKMKPFIYGQKADLHLLDLVKSHKYFRRVLYFLTKATGNGQRVLFISTREQNAFLVKKAACRCKSSYVTEKWLGGTLTNSLTVQHSVQTLRELKRQKRTGLLRRLPKKELASALRRKQKLQRSLGGIKYMPRFVVQPDERSKEQPLPNIVPNIAIIIGQNEELNAVKECNKEGIRHITILDTNNDPTLADLFIPANDDSINSLTLILESLVTAILDGQSIYRQKQKQSVQRTIRKTSQPLKKKPLKNKPSKSKLSKSKPSKTNTKVAFSPKPRALPVRVVTREPAVLLPPPVRPAESVQQPEPK